MHTRNFPFDIGIEQEFFISPLERPTIILNAQETMKGLLGFSIDQNSHPSGCLKIDQYSEIVTDGTAMEYRGFFPSSHFNWYPKEYAKQIFRTIQSLKFLQDKMVQCIALAQTPTYTFDNPNPVHSGDKQIINAYTGEKSYQEKKEGKLVTIRTTGLHIHFSLQERFDDSQDIFNLDNNLHACNLVKIFDGIYKFYFHTQRLEQERIDRYQPFGIFRVRNKRETKTGRSTLEYRQLASSHLERGFDHFVTLCQYAAYIYLSENGLLVKNN